MTKVTNLRNITAGNHSWWYSLGAGLAAAGTVLMAIGAVL